MSTRNASLAASLRETEGISEREAFAVAAKLLRLPYALWNIPSVIKEVRKNISLYTK